MRKSGFEPAIRFRRIHAFQACLFNHSSISQSSKLPILKTSAIYKKKSHLQMNERTNSKVFA